MTEQTTTPTEPIDVSKVEQAYSGKTDLCRCGCAGNYYDATNPKHLPMIRKVVKFMNEHLSEVEVTDGYIFDTKFSDTRSYTVYYQDPAK